MPDNENLLGETPEVWTGNEEKKGAPVLDVNDLNGLLGDEPQVWTGNDDKKGAPELDTSGLLDDPAQTWNEQKLGAPVLDEQVQLDEPGTYTPDAPKGGAALDMNVDDLLGGGEPETYDEVGEFCKRLQFDENLKNTFMQLDAEKQQQVVEMRAGQLGIPAPMIPNALRPKVEEALPEAADVQLEEAPEPEEYVPQFKDEDLERIKEESKKPQKYTPPPVELTEEKKKENIRIMNELREEREKELARKGFKQLILLTVIGVIGAIAFGIFFSGISVFGFKPGFDSNGIMKAVESAAPIVAIVMGISALLLALPIKQLKGITKLAFGLGTLLSLFPGIPMLIQKNNIALSAIVFVLALGGNAAVVVVMSISDAINMYNKHGNS